MKPLPQDVLIAYCLLLSLKVPRYPMDRNTLPFVTEPGVRRAPLPAPKGLAIPSLLTPSGARSLATCPR